MLNRLNPRRKKDFDWKEYSRVGQTYIYLEKKGHPFWNVKLFEEGKGFVVGYGDGYKDMGEQGFKDFDLAVDFAEKKFTEITSFDKDVRKVDVTNKEKLVPKNGKVLWYSQRTGNGIIVDDKNNEHYFDKSVCKDHDKIGRGDSVSFDAGRLSGVLVARNVKIISKVLIGKIRTFNPKTLTGYLSYNGVSFQIHLNMYDPSHVKFSESFKNGDAVEFKRIEGEDSLIEIVIPKKPVSKFHQKPIKSKVLSIPTKKLTEILDENYIRGIDGKDYEQYKDEMQDEVWRRDAKTDLILQKQNEKDREEYQDYLDGILKTNPRQKPKTYKEWVEFHKKNILAKRNPSKKIHRELIGAASSLEQINDMIDNKWNYSKNILTPVGENEWSVSVMTRVHPNGSHGFPKDMIDGGLKVIDGVRVVCKGGRYRFERVIK